MSEPGKQPGCFDEATVVRFYEGALAEDEADRLREHITTCAACLELARDAHAFVAAMRGPQAVPRQLQPRRSWAGWWLAAAAVIPILIWVAPLMRQRDAIEIVPAPYLRASLDNSNTAWRGAEGADDRFELAMRAYLAKDYQAAELALEAHVSSHSEDDRGRFYLAVTRLLRGRTADALADLSRLTEDAAEPLRSEARWYRALAWLKTGERDRAVEELRWLASSSSSRAPEARALLDRQQ